MRAGFSSSWGFGTGRAVFSVSWTASELRLRHRHETMLSAKQERRHFSLPSAAWPRHEKNDRDSERYFMELTAAAKKQAVSWNQAFAASRWAIASAARRLPSAFQWYRGARTFPDAPGIVAANPSKAWRAAKNSRTLFWVNQVDLGSPMPACFLAASQTSALTWNSSGIRTTRSAPHAAGSPSGESIQGAIPLFLQPVARCNPADLEPAGLDFEELFGTEP